MPPQRTPPPPGGSAADRRLGRTAVWASHWLGQHGDLAASSASLSLEVTASPTSGWGHRKPSETGRQAVRRP